MSGMNRRWFRLKPSMATGDKKLISVKKMNMRMLCQSRIWIVCVLLLTAGFALQPGQLNGQEVRKAATGQAAVDTRPRVRDEDKKAVSAQDKGAGTATFTNGIIWGNKRQGGISVMGAGSLVRLTKTLWYEDPLFQTIPGIGIYLPSSVEAINKGVRVLDVADTLDLLGMPRFMCLPDMGAFERQDVKMPSLTIAGVTPVCEGDRQAGISYENVENGANAFGLKFPAEWASGDIASYPFAFDGTSVPVKIPMGMPAGEYACKLIVKGGEGCEKEYDFKLKIRRVVTPSVELKLAGAPKICQGEKVSLRLSFKGEGPYAYQLNGEATERFFSGMDAGTGLVSTDTIIEKEFPRSGKMSLTSVRQADGCGGMGTVSGEVDITVVPLPDVVLSAAAAVCEGEMAPLYLEFTGNAPFSYNINGNVKERIAQTNFDTIWVAGGESYNVTRLEAGGCALAAPTALTTIAQNKRPEIGAWMITEVSCNAGNRLVATPISGETDLPVPAVTPNGTVTAQGWLLDGEPITLPYQVKNEDLNKTLSYFFVNDCGRTESAGILLKVPNSSLIVLMAGVPTVEKSREYDATLLASVQDMGMISGIDPDASSVEVSASAEYTTSGVGTGKTIIVKYALSGANAGLYAPPARYYFTDGAIQKRKLSVSGNVVKDKEYDGNTVAEISEGALQRVISGEDVRCDLTASFGQKNVAKNLPVTVSASWLAGKDCGNYEDPVLPTGLMASILRKQVTITGTTVVQDKAWDGTNTAQVSSVGSLIGVVTGEIVGVSAKAIYRKSDPGTNITIRVDYTLEGEENILKNYQAPAYNDTFRGSIFKAPAIENIVAPEAICAGGTIELTDPVVDDPNNKVIRSWWSLGGVELTTRMPQLVAADNGKMLCFNIQTTEVVAHSNEVPVTVHALPAIKVSGGGSICAPGDDAFVRIEFISGTAPYTWYLSGETDARTLAVGNVETLTVHPDVLTTYRVTAATDANGCVATDLGDEVVVSPGEKPSAVISGDAMICAGGSASVRIDFTGPAPYFYRLTGDAADRVAYTSTVWATVTPDNDVEGLGTYVELYQVESLEANGCLADVADLVGMAQITVNDVKVAALPDEWSGVIGDILDLPVPDVVGSHVGGYWMLNNKDIVLPYMVIDTDNGKWLTYHVRNVCGQPVESKTHTRLIVTDGKPQLAITDPTFDKVKNYDGSTRITGLAAGTLSGVAAGEVVTVDATGSFNNAAAAIGKQITIYYTLTGADKDKYSAPSPYLAYDGRIKPLQLTVGNPSAKDKVYDGNVSAEVVAGALTGVLPSEAGNINIFAQGAFSSKTVGAGKNVSVNYAVTGTGIGNYFPPVNNIAVASISAKDIRVIGTEVETTKLWDGNTVARVRDKGRTEGVVPGDIASFSVDANYDVADAGTGRTINVHYIPATVGDAGNYKWPADYTLYNAAIIGLPEVGSITDPGVLCARTVINLPAPEVKPNGGALSDAGRWLLDETEIMMPYTVSRNDNGKVLKYRAENKAGAGYSNEVMLVVNVLPEVQLATKAICSAEEMAQITLTFKGTAPFDYALSDGTTGTLASGNEAIAEVHPSSTTVYTVTRLKDANCVAEAPEGSATVMVSTHPTAVISGNELVCAGSDAQIQIDFTGDAPFRFRLDGDTEDRTSDITPAIVTVNPSLTTTYKLISAKAGECNVDLAYLKGEAKVSILPLPKVELSGDAVVCGGEPVEFALNFSGGTGEYVYRLTGDTADRYYKGDVAGSGTKVAVNANTTMTYQIVSLTSGACSGWEGNDQVVITRPVLPTVGTLSALPTYTLPANLAVAVPATENATRTCWLLGVDTITMPYALKNVDNGKKLSYVAWNECGDRVESNGVTVSIPDSPIKPLAVIGTQIETVRSYNGGLDAKVIAPGTLTPDPGSGVTLAVEAKFVGNPHTGNKKVEVIYTLSGSNAEKYTAPQRVLLDGRITPLQLEVSDPIVEKSKVYDRTTRVIPDVVGGTPNNVLEGDDITLAVRAEYNTRNAGVNRKIAVNYTLSGLSSVDYTSPADFVVTDAEIRQKSLGIGDPGLRKEKVYDGLRTATTLPAALVGLIEGDEVRVLASALYDNRNAGEMKAIVVGYELEGTDAANYIKPDVFTVVDGKITRLQLGAEGTEITREKAHDGSPLAIVANPGRLTNAIYSDDVVLSVNAEYEDPSIGTGKKIEVKYDIIGTDAGNYIAPQGFNLFDGVISKCPEIIVPVAPALCDGSDLNVARPAINLNGSTQEGNGWWTLDGEVIDMPYRVSAADNGHELHYHIRTLTCGIISSPAAALTVYSLPTATLKGTYTVCENSTENIELEVRIIGGEAPYNYRLTGDGAYRSAATQGNNKALINPHPTVTSSYEIVELVDTKGCVATNISGRAMVEIVPKPAVVMSGGGTVCDGETATLILDFTGKAPFTYAINGGTEQTSYDKHTVITMAPAVAGTYAVTSLKSGGCAVDPALDLVGVNVTVNVNKAPEIAALAENVCVTLGELVTIPVPIVTPPNILHSGWMLDGVAHNVPWNVIADDHGKTIHYWAENVCGRTESSGLQVRVKNSPSVLLLVEGVTVEEKIYDGELAGVADMTNAKIYAQTMDNTNCSLSKGVELIGITLRPTVRFDNPNVGDSHKVIVSYTIAINTTGDGNTYIAPKDSELTGKIKPASLMIDDPALVASRPYDRTVKASVTAGAIKSNVAFGDEVRISATAAYRDKKVGEAKPVDVAYQLGGRSAGNYQLAPSTQTEYAAAITPIPLAAIGEQVKSSKRYDGNKTAVVSRQATISGVIVGDLVSVVTGGTYDSPEIGRRKVTVGFTRNVAGDDGENYILPKSYLLSGAIYDIPTYISPLEGVADQLCAGDVIIPEVPGYRLNEAPLVSAGWTIRRGGVSGPFKAPYKVSAEDHDAILCYVVRNEAGYGVDNENNTKQLVVNDKPIVAKTLAPLPAMEQAKELLVPADHPAVSGSLATAQGWALVTRDQDITTAQPLELPYTVSLEDNGKYLVYWAKNDCGYSESNRVALNIYKLYPVQIYAEVMFESKKRYDGTTEAKLLSVYNIRGVETGHVVKVDAKAAYDTPEPDDNKQITVTFTLSGADAGKYVKPEPYTVDYGWIYDRPWVETPANPGLLCVGDTIDIPEPAWHNNAAAVLKTGWSLGSRPNEQTITMPYVVKIADAGKTLSFWAVNTEGLGEGQITLDVRPRPTVIMPKDTVINIGGTAMVVYQFKGTAPFTYTLKDGQTGVTSPAQSNYIDKVTPEHAQYYGVNVLSDAYCKAWPEDLRDSMLVQINGDNIRIMVGDTIFVYDGEPKGLEVHAEPNDRTDSLKVYYDGSTARPYLPGSYPTVVKFGGDWQFGPLEKHVTVIIEKAYAEVLLDDLYHLYDGRPKQAKIATNPNGLNLMVTYNDSTALPVASGRYRVHAEVREGLWQGVTEGLLVIQEFTEKAEMINTIEVRGNNNTKFLVKDYERYTDMKVKLFDKSGKLIYKSDNYAGYEYDMRDLRAGTYYYVLTYKNEGQDETRRGAVTVIK